MKISVIIPVYKDWDRLNKCIEALSNQTLQASEFEVLIVNNEKNFTPNLQQLPINIFVITEDKPGSYAARNAGIKEAKGLYYAFTDSDCIPEKDWLEKSLKYLETGHKRLGGRVKLFYKSEKLSLAEIYEKGFAFNQKQYVRDGTSVTANMIASKAAFDIVGLFNDSLMSGGDMEWGWRAQASGFDIFYASDVIVNHPARDSMDEILSKAKRVATGISGSTSNDYRKSLISVFIKGYLPPKEILNVLGSNEFTLKEKLISTLTAYFVKGYVTTLTIINRLNKKKTSDKNGRNFT